MWIDETNNVILGILLGYKKYTFSYLMQLLNHNRRSEKSKVKVHLFIYRHIGIKHGLTPICLLQTNWALSFIMYSHFVIDKHRKRIKCSIYNCYWSCKIGMLCLWELCLLFVFHYYKMFSSYNGLILAIFAIKGLFYLVVKINILTIISVTFKTDSLML